MEMKKPCFQEGNYTLLMKKIQKHDAVYGEFSSKDLLIEWLEPGQAVERTTQY